jgi:hypothetical protein
MQKKLTITIDGEVYEGLRRNVATRKISKFIEELVRFHGIHPDLELAYTEMAKDEKREKEAVEWAEVTFKDLWQTENMVRGLIYTVKWEYPEPG